MNPRSGSKIKHTKTKIMFERDFNASRECSEAKEQTPSADEKIG